jgi:hypothetical protein
MNLQLSPSCGQGLPQFNATVEQAGSFWTLDGSGGGPGESKPQEDVSFAPPQAANNSASMVPLSRMSQITARDAPAATVRNASDHGVGSRHGCRSDLRLELMRAVIDLAATTKRSSGY